MSLSKVLGTEIPSPSGTTEVSKQVGFDLGTLTSALSLASSSGIRGVHVCPVPSRSAAGSTWGTFRQGAHPGSSVAEPQCTSESDLGNMGATTVSQ